MNWMDFMMRILLAVLLGFLIGLERQITGHTAGIRINVLISMGSCLFLMFPIITGSDEVYRIASYIVSGVGFLCSGVIFKDGGTVRGLNTAATLWCTAAIGVLASSGYFLLASAATGTLILSNLLFRPPVHENQAGYRLGGERKTLPHLNHLPGSQRDRHPCSPH